MTSDALAKLRAKIKSGKASDTDIDAIIMRAKKTKDYSATTMDAFDATRSHNLALDMLGCSDWYDGNQQTCHSLYCAKKGERQKVGHKKAKEAKSCYKRITNKQTALMRSVVDRYDNNDKAMRQNLRSMTILFSAYGFDLDKHDNPIFPLYKGKNGSLSGVVMDAKKLAAKQLKKVKDRFPNVKWLGGYSWEVQHLNKLGGKKSVSLGALIGLNDQKFATACQKVFQDSNRIKWGKHYINFHCHLVVDLNGTDDKVFGRFCHSVWGQDGNKKRPVPDGVRIIEFKRAYYKSVPESLDTLAQYPFRNQWDYKFKYAGDVDKDIVDHNNLLEAEVLSALISATRLINKHSSLVINNNWNDK